ncbi:uncharacterized protein LOC123327435 [Drosophila simulans]|uniref:uncharacterized protein LOC123327435 n=1 Tax=Drosophila simulans TaxID=7240 RepID=UPI001D12668D|nr:uncharacterized protein LOC123327435 [Drosophila simulans]
MDMGAVLGDRASLRALTQTKVFVIRDLDELTTEDELKSALEAQAEIPAAVVAIKSLRQSQYGGKTAVIAVPANLTDPLIKRGKLRLNLNHCTAAQDLLVQTVRERRVELALLSEPYRTPASPDWAFDRTKKAAIWRCSRETQQITDVLSDIGFVRARVGRWWVYSVYLAPSLTLIAFSRALDRLAADARGRTQVLIAGDFNAWSESWGSSTTNARGRMVLEAFATLDLALLNHGNRHTFRRAGMGSVVDLTFTSGSSYRLARWRLSEDYTGSDHLAIICDLGSPPSSQAQTPAQARIKYKTDSLDTQVFREQFLPMASRQGAELTAVELMRRLKAAAQLAKRVKTPQLEIEEMGEILDDLLTKVNLNG